MWIVSKSGDDSIFRTAQTSGIVHYTKLALMDLLLNELVGGEGI